MKALQEGRDPRAIEQESQDRLEEFLGVRQKYLIY